MKGIKDCSMREIVTIYEKNQLEVLKILPLAFKNDPMFHYIFPHDQQLNYLQSFFSFLFYKSLKLKELTIGVKEDHFFTSVANIELPNSTKGFRLLFIPGFLYEVIRLFRKIPLGSFIYMNQYMKFTTSVRPKKPHHYLSYIGVHPEQQGKGIGKMLMNYIHELSDSDSASIGIGLDTENPKNIKYYEAFGYCVIDYKKIGDVTIYSMFRPKVNN